MLANPDIRNWISTIFGVAILVTIFGADLLFFQKAGTTTDVALIVGAIGALGIPTSYAAGKRVATINAAN